MINFFSHFPLSAIPTDMKKAPLEVNTLPEKNGQLPHLTLVEYQEKDSPDLGSRKNSNASDNVFEELSRKSSQLNNPMYKPPSNAYSYGMGINPLVLRHGRMSLQAGHHGVSHSPEPEKRISLSRNEGVDSSMYHRTPSAPMRDEDRRPSGASDSEMYDSREDVWQMRPDGQEFSPQRTHPHPPHPHHQTTTLTMPPYGGEDAV